MSIMSILVASGAKGRPSPSYVFSASTADASLNVASLSGYIAGKSDITITVDSGVYLWSTTISGAGLTLTGGTTGDTVTLVNNGFIMGKGGDGTNATSGTTWVAAQAGGTAVSLGFATSINNSAGYIGGGGGGGGGEYSAGGASVVLGGAGGAGGGNAGAIASTNSPIEPGAIGGAIGLKGADGAVLGSSAAGGRILPGTNTTLSAVGDGASWFFVAGLGGTAGGTGGISTDKNTSTYISKGGGPAEAGSTQVIGSLGVGSILGAGGGWGAAGSISMSSAVNLAAGAGGKAVSLNGKSITWVGGTASSSRAYGAVA